MIRRPAVVVVNSSSRALRRRFISACNPRFVRTVRVGGARDRRLETAVQRGVHASISPTTRGRRGRFTISPHRLIVLVIGGGSVVQRARCCGGKKRGVGLSCPPSGGSRSRHSFSDSSRPRSTARCAHDVTSSSTSARSSSSSSSSLASATESRVARPVCAHALVAHTFTTAARTSTPSPPTRKSSRASTRRQNSFHHPLSPSRALARRARDSSSRLCRRRRARTSSSRRAHPTPRAARERTRTPRTETNSKNDSRPPRARRDARGRRLPAWARTRASLDGYRARDVRARDARADARATSARRRARWTTEEESRARARASASSLAATPRARDDGVEGWRGTCWGTP